MATPVIDSTLFNSIQAVYNFYAALQQQQIPPQVQASQSFSAPYGTLLKDAEIWENEIMTNMSSVSNAPYSNQTVSYYLADLTSNVAISAADAILQNDISKLIGTAPGQGVYTQLYNLIVDFVKGGGTETGNTNLSGFQSGMQTDYNDVSSALTALAQDVTNASQIIQTINDDMNKLLSEIDKEKKELIATDVALGVEALGAVTFILMGPVEWAVAAGAIAGTAYAQIWLSQDIKNLENKVTADTKELAGDQAQLAQMQVLQSGLKGIQANDETLASNGMAYIYQNGDGSQPGVWMQFLGLATTLNGQLTQMAGYINASVLNYLSMQTLMPKINASWAALQQMATNIYFSTPLLTKNADKTYTLQLPKS